MKSGQTPPPPFFLPEPVLAEVLHLLGGRKKIQAIKVIRDVTRCGLKEAKDLADAMERGYRPPVPPPQPYASPQPYAAPQQSLAARARAFRDAGDPDRAVALVQAETGMTREEAARFLAALG